MSNILIASTPRQCGNAECRHSQRVSDSDLFMIRVPGLHGGSRNAPAFRCSVCSDATAIDARLISQRSLNTIPSEKTYDERLGCLAWETGARARNLLQQRIEGGMKAHGYAIAYIREDEGVTTRQYSLSNRCDLLQRLDDEGIDLLLISGIGSDGRRWRTVFHSQAGASAFRGTIDPVWTTVRAILTLGDFDRQPIAA